jgi:hypothetical protein
MLKNQSVRSCCCFWHATVGHVTWVARCGNANAYANANPNANLNPNADAKRRSKVTSEEVTEQLKVAEETVRYEAQLQ